MAIDLEADAAAAPSDISPALSLAKSMRELKAKIERGEDWLKEAKDKYHKMETLDLPELMQSMGLSSFKMEDGVSISIEDFVKASIPSLSAIDKCDDQMERDGLIEKRASCFKWLREHNHESLIKNEVSVAFGKGQDEQARAIMDLLKTKGLAPHQEESVHYQTLNAFVREQLKKGTDIPFSLFDVYQGKKAEIVLPKKPKQKK